MNLFIQYIICIIASLVLNWNNNAVLGFHSSNYYRKHNFKTKYNCLNSYNSESSTLVSDITIPCKEDLLSRTKEWILSKNQNDLISSAHFDGNFNNLFPSQRGSSGGVLLGVKDASIWLGETVLFDNVSFSVNTGECVGIVGNNGVGKSSLFDSIYNRLSGSGLNKPNMSVSMDIKFNIKDDVNSECSNNYNLYQFLSQIMDRESLTPSEFLQLYNNFKVSDDETEISTYNLSGVGYMRQNYTLDLDSNATVSGLISKVFHTYNLCNNVMKYIERNLQFFNNLMSEQEFKKVSGEILSLYNNESKMISQKFEDMKTLIKKLVSIFGMEGVINSTVNSLSGGFKMRLYLFLLLLHSPNLLLLDEPTNNLDTTTVKFLIDVLNHLMKNSKLSVLLVSHDIHLLNSICTSIFQMPGDGTITSYKGSSEKNIRNSKIEKLKKNITVLTRDINELRNSRKGSLNALRVTISQKQDLLNKYQQELDELVGSPISKYTKTYNRVLFNETDSFSSIFQKILNKNRMINTGQNLNNLGPLFKLNNVTLETNSGKRVFENLNLTVYPYDRIILLGDNGIGKTTLLKLLFKSQETFKNNPILNQISSIDKKLLYEGINSNAVEKGSKSWELFEQINRVNRDITNLQDSVYNSDGIEYRILMNEPFNFKLVDGLMMMNTGKLSYYSQNCSNILNYEKTVYELVRDYVGKDVEDELLIDYLSCFHLKEYVQSQVSLLSFGERSRLLLSLLLINKSHFLLMDEPTNHLDLFMKKLLKLIFNDIYKGGFIIATHDLEFIQDLGNIQSFIYIYGKDEVFRFNNKFGPEYIKFKYNSPDSDILPFLNQLQGDELFCKIAKSTISEDLGENKKVFKKKKKIHPPKNPNDRTRLKNYKRWK